MVRENPGARELERAGKGKHRQRPQILESAMSSEERTACAGAARVKHTDQRGKAHQQTDRRGQKHSNKAAGRKHLLQTPGTKDSRHRTAEEAKGEKLAKARSPPMSPSTEPPALERAQACRASKRRETRHGEISPNAAKHRRPRRNRQTTPAQTGKARKRRETRQGEISPRAAKPRCSSWSLQLPMDGSTEAGKGKQAGKKLAKGEISPKAAGLQVRTTRTRRSETSRERNCSRQTSKGGTSTA